MTSPDQKPTQTLHELGQSLWLDNISRKILDDGTLSRYIRDYSITGLTSNPSIFDKAIAEGDSYDAGIRKHHAAGLQGEELFITLALEDLRRAAELFRPTFEKTNGADGWVSMEISPLLATDTQGSIAAAAHIHDQAQCPNLFVKIPGTPEGVPAIEESIFAGVPINVTLLFSVEQYLASAHAYLRGIERRLEAGRDPRVSSVASLFVSRWDVAVHDRVEADMRNQLGIAVAIRTYQAWCKLLSSDRWRRLADAGAWPQRLLWASTGTKDPQASDTLYVEALAAADTINTIPDKTLHALADHGDIDAVIDANDAEATRVLETFSAQGIDLTALAERLQGDGAQAFSKSWQQLLERLEEKAGQLQSAEPSS